MTLFSCWFPRLHPGLSPYLVEDLLQVGRAHAVSQVAVGRVGEEELAFSSQGSCDIFLTIDVLLASVHDSNVACGCGGGQGAFSLAGSEGLEVKGKGCHVGQGHGLPTSAQREQLVLQNIAGICALVHQVQLSDDPDGALTWGEGVAGEGCLHLHSPSYRRPQALLIPPHSCYFPACAPSSIHSPWWPKRLLKA